ncbi:MAG: hypothetical protein Q7S74_03100 [Nanoarchaeota archaeon]|nr:hypothetical protein [Nanoarchaeota archaeon]
MRLNPCIIFSSGIAASGKTSTMKELARRIDNVFYIDRDDINQANLHVADTRTPELPDFKDYVNNDSVDIEQLDTPFGNMLRVNPNNAFYRRHIRDQSYLVQAQIAKTNLALEKAVIFDCITARQIQDGTLRKFMDYDILSGYSKHLIHFTANEEDMYNRIIERAKSDPFASKRVEFKRTSSRELFHKFVTEEQPMIPAELKNYEHLLLNTSEDTIQNNVERCMDYISKH